MKTAIVWALGFCSLAASGCKELAKGEARNRETPPPFAAPEPVLELGDRAELRSAHARIGGVDNPTSGTAVLAETPDGVKLVVELHGAPPGEHGIHVHEKGDCSDPKNESMGKHFTPEGHRHGLPGAPQKHMGDLGNIPVGADGNARLEIVAEGARLAPGDARSLLGRALIIHEKRDTGADPSGDSGPPIACAVIEAGPRPR